VAKPAEQTPLIAMRAVQLLHQAGIPAEALNLIPGTGPVAGATAIADPRIAGVAFTGSTQTAWAINQTLAKRQGPIPVLIAETGGQNAMIVDSSALPEQVVLDVIRSAFHSAGQRCSALRVLFLQEEVADRTINMLIGAMETLRLGDPGLLSTDIGPVIDPEAKTKLMTHAEKIIQAGKRLYQIPISDDLAHGTFFGPLAVEIPRMDLLTEEIFGPVLHVIRYTSHQLDSVIDAINATGYGLTLGIHSRIDDTIRHIAARARVGNIYVNRNMVGAVVGVQPFGGQGLSGTGPKAGGPYYLSRFAHERVLTINTAAVGGNATLLTSSGDKD
jgi:RHH-type proline utilization regulon transcriptional repressor/proline dehydrogenase/delta 1-pyrroline-5-carboxylate dehydrogenase